jgi:hypothetical protein
VVIKQILWCLVALALLWSDQASAKILTRCGASNGVSFFFPGPAITAEQSGWQKDGVSGGSLQLLANGNEYDVVYTDATGGTRSARADGFEVIGVNQPQTGFLLVFAVNAQGGVMEHWLFRLDGFGAGTVAWGTLKASGPIQKSSLFSAKCSRP